MAEKFRVRVWDNFHYMDDEEAYDLGEFDTYEEALEAAKRIVEESVRHHGYDNAQYTMFGEDPGILGPKTDHPLFSARDYARELCAAKETTEN